MAATTLAIAVAIARPAMTNKDMMSAKHSLARPLDAFAVALTIVLCLSWGFNQVAVKLALPDIPPLIQAAIRSAGAALIVALWAWLKDIPLLDRDRTLLPGIVAGVLFGAEFLLIYRGLLWTTASRAVLFIYLAPFFVVLGARWLLPGDRFGAAQWAGLTLSFAGMVVAFGLPTPAADPRQLLGDVMMVAAAAAWAATTLVIKASALTRVSSEKTMLYQLVVSAPMLALGAAVFGERMAAMPSLVPLASLAYQTIWVVSVTFVLWFALIVRYSASRLSVFTFLTPLFGVAAGYLVLGEPLTPAFAAAVALVATGLILVNRPR
jgi:drug/metabolite transporter (DMT)-like permease